ncbi:hypothetical protein J8J14_10855 [Roseomonas sp. SSH11]|uniref:Uncharacterized protein n=1 Tax=Pararoseomonas baculiformis TaxID=2820812 RepID=A0ABS4AE36_9PROT|nr:hypothetical protein [Pararoseomonas baculiformis]MBP0445277.1 hypothetical protein [Pararoseomonas baculiformis]
MTTAKKANQRAEELGSGKGGTSNAEGPAAGAGTAPSQEARHDNQHNLAGTPSAKAASGRPGHKNTD